MIYLFILFTLFLTFIFLASSNKEYLEIFKHNNNIYFLLSGDEYLVLKNIESNSEEKLITKAIKHYRNELGSIVEKITLINIGNEKLEYKLNNLINKN